MLTSGRSRSRRVCAFETLTVSAFISARLSDRAAIPEPAFQKFTSVRLFLPHVRDPYDFSRELSGRFIFIRNNCTIGTAASALIFQRSHLRPRKAKSATRHIIPQAPPKAFRRGGQAG